MLRQYVVQAAQNRRRGRWAPRQQNRGGNRNGQPYGDNPTYAPQPLPALPAPNPGGHPGDNRAVNGVIQTIFSLPEGMSKSALKAQARRVPPQEPVHKRLRHDETITFSEADAVPPLSPHTNALVIQAIVANKEVHRDHIDQGSAVDVLYVNCFRQLGINFDHLQPTTMPLTGFTTELVRPLGTITLAVTVGNHPREKTLMSTFYVIDSPSPFNIILGRPWINGAKAVPSTYHLCVKFPTDHGIATVRGNQRVAQECMRIAFRTDAPPITQGGVNSVILKEEPVDLELDGTSTFDSGEPSLEQKEEPYPEINYELESVKKAQK